MKKLLLLLFILSASLIQSQTKTSIKLDSLLQISKTQKGISLISTLNEISWEFKNSNIDSALFYARKSINISKRINNKKAIASSYNSLANCFDGLGVLDSAQIYHQKSLDIKLQIGHLVGAADSYNNLGIVYDLKGNFSKALENYFKALKIYESQEVEFGKVPMVLGNIGIVYKKQKEYDKVLNYYKKALKIYEDNNYDFGIVVTKGNIGSVLLNIKKFENSIKYSNEAKELYAQLGYNRYVPYMINNIAIAKDSLKDYKQSQLLYKEAIALFRKDQNLYELTYAQIGLAKSYAKEHKFKASSSEVKSALKMIKEKGFKEFEIEAYKLLANVEEQLGNYKQAYHYFEKYAIGKDSLFEENKTKTIFELETKYETEKKEKEILLQRADLAEKELSLSKKNIQILGLGVLAIILILLGYLFYNQQKIKNKQLQKENELKDALVKIETQNHLQEQRLRISRDLHDNIGAQLTFIISSIDNLKYGFKITNDKLNSKLVGISQFTKDTIYELRDTIWAMNKSKITFEDLKTRITNFIDKANTTSINTVFEFTCEANIDTEKTFTSVEGMNIYRIIQEAVNNALKYAEASKISMDITKVDGNINIQIYDNGKGFDEKEIEYGNGINNMKKRAQDIGAEIVINSSKNRGTSIVLKINNEH
jgi:signal transduction histidine kinase